MCQKTGRCVGARGSRVRQNSLTQRNKPRLCPNHPSWPLLSDLLSSHSTPFPSRAARFSASAEHHPMTSCPVLLARCGIELWDRLARVGIEPRGERQGGGRARGTRGRGDRRLRDPHDRWINGAHLDLALRLRHHARLGGGWRSLWLASGAFKEDEDDQQDEKECDHARTDAHDDGKECATPRGRRGWRRRRRRRRRCTAP